MDEEKQKSKQDMNILMQINAIGKLYHLRSAGER